MYHQITGLLCLRQPDKAQLRWQPNQKPKNGWQPNQKPKNGWQPNKKTKMCLTAEI